MSLNQQAAESAARTLLAARRAMTPIAGLPDAIRPQDEASAYAVQAAYVPMVLEMSGGNAVGYKVGATNDAVQQRMGIVQPFRGLLLSPFVHASPARIPRESCIIRVLEVEFAYRVGRDLPAAGAPYDQAAVKGAMAALLPAIEIVDSRYADWSKAGGLQLIADNASGGHWVYGDAVVDWQGIDLADYKVSLSVNGERKADGSSSNVLGHPLKSMVWLANALAAAGDGLKAGQVVTTGSCTTPVMASPGDSVVADFGPLGQVRVDFD